jgi:hypothetical protein
MKLSKQEQCVDVILLCWLLLAHFDDFYKDTYMFDNFPRTTLMVVYVLSETNYCTYLGSNHDLKINTRCAYTIHNISSLKKNNFIRMDQPSLLLGENPSQAMSVPTTVASSFPPTLPTLTSILSAAQAISILFKDKPYAYNRLHLNPPHRKQNRARR